VRLLFAFGAIAAAIAAALVALSARDLRRTWTWPDEMDAVQPSDPWPPVTARSLWYLGNTAVPTIRGTWDPETDGLGLRNVEPVSEDEARDITPYWTLRTIGGMH
jgi:hypothetical protein